MTDDNDEPGGPDLTQGIPVSQLPDGAMLGGHVGKKPVLIAHVGEAFYAIGAKCPHYGGPLAEGLLVGETVRCPWHHACISLRTGAALRPPALDPVSCWRVERNGERLVVKERIKPAPADESRKPVRQPESVVIIGAGAAGNAAAETLRREGYEGPITMFSADDAPPYDRPTLSKEYMEGSAQEEWISLRSADFYADHRIDLKLTTRVAGIDKAAREVRLADGSRHGFDAALIATGAEPVRLEIPGADLPHVRTLRTFSDARALVSRAGNARHAVVVGASFIGLEVASGLRARDITVHVVAPEEHPMERTMGREIGDFLRRVHEEHGVVFHLQSKLALIDATGVQLENGERIDADLVVVGIGVRPVTGLAEEAGLTMDRGVVVNQYLETSAPNIFAAGDIARWPDRLTGERIRVEHWVVAERQGQTAARNMLGRRERFDAVPFFWTHQHDVTLNYVGHAENWDRIETQGSIADRDATVIFWRGQRKLAVVTIGRDMASLQAECDLEKLIAAQGTA